MLDQREKVPGFTLVELLIVVIILAILAAIVVPQFSTSTQDAKISALDNTLANVRSAIDLYRQQHGVYPGLSTAVPAAGCATGTKGTGTGVSGAQAATALTEQLTLYTDIAGGACSIADATFKFGPYLKTADNAIPPNPVTEDATLVIETTGDLAMTSATNPGAGWKYDVKSGKFIADDAAYADH
ncbi:MAG: type II secretion system protein [Gammaproteobacteria bacterium]|jgi:prepilin-type N-terminal cleavage/methylation domain-containing protein